MSIVGMDVEQVRQLAKDLHLQADLVDDAIRTVDGRLSGIGSAWRGPDVDRFRDWWASQHRPALIRARDAIEGLSRVASDNADGQERVSSGADGAASFFSVSGLVPSVLSAVSTVANSEVGGVKPWDLIKALGVAGEFEGIPGFKYFGTAGDVVQIMDYADKIVQGTFDLQDGFDLTADIMQWLPLGPVGDLGGAAIHTWNDAAREAMKADWSAEAMAQTWDYARENPGVVVDELAKATMVVGSRVLGYFNIP